MKVLITGGNGTIGSELSKALGKRGHIVYGCGRNHLGTTSLNYRRVDIRNYNDIDKFIKITRPDIVYNCAAEFGRWNGENYYQDLWTTNCIGLKNILRIQSKIGFNLVHFSSSEVYGDYDLPMSEDVMDKVEIKQLNDYAMSKWANEQQIINAQKTWGTKIVRLRLFNTYGPGEYFHPYRSVNCVFTYKLLNHEPITVYKGHQRSSTYIDDAVFAIANLTDTFRAGEVYNIGSNKTHDIETLASIIQAKTGAPKELIHYGNSEPMTTKIKICVNDKAVKDLGFKDTVTLEEGVASTVAWMRTKYDFN